MINVQAIVEFIQNGADELIRNNDQAREEYEGYLAEFNGDEEKARHTFIWMNTFGLAMQALDEDDDFKAALTGLMAQSGDSKEDVMMNITMMLVEDELGPLNPDDEEDEEDYDEEDEEENENEKDDEIEENVGSGRMTLRRMAVNPETGESKRDLFFETMGAANGDVGSMIELAQAYLNGDGVEKDDKEAFRWMLRAAESGRQDALYNVGLFYAQGIGVKRDFAKGVEWLRKAEEAGDEDAPGMIRQYEQAAHYQLEAETGNAKAQAKFAEFLMKVRSEQNLRESFEWAQKAADQNDFDGLYILGLCWQHGRGVRANAKKAAETYQKAAKQGHAPSQHNLGCMYMNGAVGGRDGKKLGYEWLKKAAEQDYELSFAALGSCYERGEGVKHDIYKAIEWFEKAAQASNNAQIQHHLALMCLNQIDGKEIDHKRAVYWYGEAGKNGDRMSQSMYAMWTYIDKQVEAGLIAENAEVPEIFAFIQERAEAGDKEARKVEKMLKER